MRLFWKGAVHATNFELGQYSEKFYKSPAHIMPKLPVRQYFAKKKRLVRSRAPKAISARQKTLIVDHGDDIRVIKARLARLEHHAGLTDTLKQ